MRRLFLPRVAVTGVEGVIERLAINVLGVVGQEALEIFGQVGVAGVGHAATSGQAPFISSAIASAAAAGSAARVMGLPMTI